MHGGNRISDDIRRVASRPWAFLTVFLAAFFVLSTVLYSLDFYPEPKTVAKNTEQTGAVAGAESTAQFPVEAPVRIAIAKIGVDTTVGNPASADISVLDNALLAGAVRYPGSALLGQDSRMFIFGHQSYLPVVRNQAFKAFNGLQKLEWGDEILVYSDTAVYRYRVSSVEHASAKEDWVELEKNDRMLILTTCDSFGQKTDRYVVKAQFVSRELITNSGN